MDFKEKFGKFKEGAAKFTKTTARFNSLAFCGNVNRGIKNADFWEGSYVNIENGHGIIYGVSQEDYIFTANDIKTIELIKDLSPKVTKGNETYTALRYIFAFNDGKAAQIDLIVDKLDTFKNTFQMDQKMI
ncbi:MAG: hypothetical protein E7556_07535 [Ruminococcaceae bacterium]|nr:hypothetical protein [Oscillospiraceae bacterium]